MTEQGRVSEQIDVEGFPKRLKTARVMAGMTQVSIARELGVARQTYLDLESGKTDPRISTLRDLAKLTGQSAAWLATGESRFYPLKQDKAASIRALKTQAEALLNEILSLEAEVNK